MLDRPSGTPPVDSLPAWAALEKHATDQISLRDQFAADPERFARFSVRLDEFLFDYSKQLVTPEIMADLIELARQAKIEEWRHKMFAGQPINTTENRSVLHVALRDKSERVYKSEGHEVKPDVAAVLARMRVFVDSLASGRRKGATGQSINTLVNIGIGGSDLGPAMATKATPTPRPPTVEAESEPSGQAPAAA
jgi:glucose-6-phosphate isomerase